MTTVVMRSGSKWGRSYAWTESFGTIVIARRIGEPELPGEALEQQYAAIGELLMEVQCWYDLSEGVLLDVEACCEVPEWVVEHCYAEP